MHALSPKCVAVLRFLSREGFATLRRQGGSRARIKNINWKSLQTDKGGFGLESSGTRHGERGPGKGEGAHDASLPAQGKAASFQKLSAELTCF